MGESNRVRWSYTTEASFGEDTSGEDYTEIRRTGGSLKRPQDTKVSNEVRSTRKRGTAQRTGVSAQGDLQAELSYGSHDDLIAGALAGVWSAAINVAATDIEVIAGNIYQRATGSWVGDGAVVGMVVDVTGFTEAENNGFKRVTAVDSTDLTVAQTLVVEGPGDSVVFNNDGMLKDGTTKQFFSFEQEHLDLTQVFRFKGMLIDGFTLDVPAEDLITLSMDLLGKDAERDTASERGSLIAANTDQVFNGTSNIFDLEEGGAAWTDIVTKIGLTSRNNSRSRKGLSFLTPQSIILGTSDIEGSVELYFANGTLVDKYLNFTESSVSWRILNSLGKGYVITVPRLFYTGDLPDAGGLDGDVMLTMPFRALEDSATGAQVIINRFAD